MGLFLTEDGHFQGWLAALFCCCAALTEDEHPVEKRDISRPTTARNTVWLEQPAPLKAMLPPHNNDSASSLQTGVGAASFTADDDPVRPISERPPFLQPFDLGDSPLHDRMHPRRKASTNLQLRMSVGNPTEHRRQECHDRQRMSLKPLQLSPVVLREATPEPSSSGTPTERFTSRNEDMDVHENHDPHRTSRSTPFERFQLLSSAASLPSPHDSCHSSSTGPGKNNHYSGPPLSTRSSSSSIRSLRRPALEAGGSSNSTPSRHSMDKSRLKRKRSYQLNASGSADLDVDREILELNTIIEERRAESTRPQTPAAAGSHVPAVAPSMPVRARSETLTDIGSAFSRPLTRAGSDLEAQADAQALSPIVSPVRSRLSRPFMSALDPSIIAQAESAPVRRPSSRVTGWLANLFSSSSSHQPSSTAYHRRFRTSSPRHRATSETSLCTTDSPCITATTTSSPTSKTHSRSLTAESRMTGLMTPASTIVGGGAGPDTGGRPNSTIEPWPLIEEVPSQVGLAL